MIAKGVAKGIAGVDEAGPRAAGGAGRGGGGRARSGPHSRRARRLQGPEPGDPRAPLRPHSRQRPRRPSPSPRPRRSPGSTSAARRSPPWRAPSPASSPPPRSRSSTGATCRRPTSRPAPSCGATPASRRSPRPPSSPRSRATGWMVRLDLRHPGYGFAIHKGYPVPAHLEALMRLGPCPEHRRGFSPVERAYGSRGPGGGVETCLASVSRWHRTARPQRSVRVGRAAFVYHAMRCFACHESSTRVHGRAAGPGVRMDARPQPCGPRHHQTRRDHRRRLPGGAEAAPRRVRRHGLRRSALQPPARRRPQAPRRERRRRGRRRLGQVRVVCRLRRLHARMAQPVPPRVEARRHAVGDRPPITTSSASARRCRTWATGSSTTSSGARPTRCRTFAAGASPTRTRR